jgi:hypothetical protein
VSRHSHVPGSRSSVAAATRKQQARLAVVGRGAGWAAMERLREELAGGRMEHAATRTPARRQTNMRVGVLRSTARVNVAVPLLLAGGVVYCVVLASHGNAAQGTNGIPRSAFISQARCGVLLLLTASASASASTSRLETAARSSQPWVLLPVTRTYSPPLKCIPTKLSPTAKRRR